METENNENKLKNFIKGRRKAVALGLWNRYRTHRKEQQLTSSILKRIVSNPAVVGLVASSTAITAASGLGMIATNGDTDRLSERVVVLEKRIEDTAELRALYSQLAAEIQVLRGSIPDVSGLLARVDQLSAQLNEALQQGQINSKDIEALRISLEMLRKDLEDLPERVPVLEKKLDDLIEEFRSHEHPHDTTTTTTTTTTVPTTTTSTVPPTSSTTISPSTTTTTTESKKECLTRTTRGDERYCPKGHDWSLFRWILSII